MSNSLNQLYILVRMFVNCCTRFVSLQEAARCYRQLRSGLWSVSLDRIADCGGDR